MTISPAKWLKPLFIAAVLAVSVGLLASACGGGSSGSASGGDASSDEGGAEAVAFDVTMNDSGSGAAVNFFDGNEFTVAPGQQVTFNLTNEGIAIHNMRIAGPDGQYNTDDDVVSQAEMVNPGETAVLTWTAPEEPGVYEFRCDFHPTDMLGTVKVG